MSKSGLDWRRVNVWTITLYTLIQSLELAYREDFGDLERLGENIRTAAGWVPQVCSYRSVITKELGKRDIKFRSQPSEHFEASIAQIIKMLVQDLVVILDEMSSEALILCNVAAGEYPQSKIERLSLEIRNRYMWSAQGCLELIAARNVLTHNGGRWNERSVNIVKSFVEPPPAIGEMLIIGFPMLFRYRKAMRTFLNEVLLSVKSSKAAPSTSSSRARTRS